MNISLTISAFLAGLLTFLAPCTLPLVPGYLGFISGASLKDLNDPKKAGGVKKKIFYNGLAFILGFSVIFIIFGALAGLFGATLAPFRIWLTRIGGVFVILFGIFMLDLINIPFLNRQSALKIPKWFERGRLVNSFLLGAAFGFGWTPCVGPVLAAILVLASSTTTVFQGAFLLGIFSFGLAIPFLLIAIGIGHAGQYIKKISKYLKWVSYIGGVFLILLGILLFTDRMSLLISWGFQLLDSFGYAEIQNYL